MRWYLFVLIEWCIGYVILKKFGYIKKEGSFLKYFFKWEGFSIFFVSFIALPFSIFEGIVWCISKIADVFDR